MFKNLNFQICIFSEFFFFIAMKNFHNSAQNPQQTS